MTTDHKPLKKVDIETNTKRKVVFNKLTSGVEYIMNTKTRPMENKTPNKSFHVLIGVSFTRNFINTSLSSRMPNIDGILMKDL